MVEVGYIFPGQGAQYVGMGKRLYDKYEIARDTFDHANRILGFDITKLCFEGPVEELIRTENCQVAILVASIAALRVYLTQPSEFIPHVTLGLSLGEYTALVASEALTFSDAVKLVRMRGEYMEEAAMENPGKMVSILGLELKDVENICGESDAEIANLNCPGQIVISGRTDSIEKAVSIAKKKNAKVIILEVSGAFHSSIMASASYKLAKALKEIIILRPKIPVVSNVTAYSEDKPDMIKENLIDQVSALTRWEESIRNVSNRGIRTFLEIGPGTVLRGLLHRIDSNLVCHNVPA